MSFSCILSLTAFAQNEATDLSTGYTLKYGDCFEAKKKKDPPVCVSYEHIYLLKGDSLITDYSQKYAVSGRDNGSRSSVPVKKISITDCSIKQDADGFTDSTLTHRDLWVLRIETKSHEQSVQTHTYSQIIGNDVMYGYSMKLFFLSEQEAEDALQSIRDAVY
ncbi:MAG: hypothetical protein R2794_10840 [Chitinophagales bacterium]